MKTETLKNKTISLEPMHLRASLVPSSIKEEERKVGITFSTGSRGLRFDWDFGKYLEELSMDPNHIRWDRLKNAAPVLDSHNSYELDAVIGVVEDAGIKDGVAVADIRMSDDEETAPIWQKIKSGIISKVSVGYRVHKYEKVGEEEGVPVMRATDWEPFEVSFVAIPFDDNARVRAKRHGNAEKYPCELILTREGDMMDEVEKKEGEVAVDKPVEAAVEAPAQEEKPDAVEAVKEESKEEPVPAEASVDERSLKILTLCKRHGFDINFAERLIASKVDEVQAREQIIEELSKRSASVKIDNTGSGVSAGSYDEATVRREGMVEWMLHRADRSKFKMTGKGDQYRNMTLLDLARDHLEAHGVKTRNLSKYDVASKALSHTYSMQVRTGYHGSSDFASLLLDAANKSLRQAYEQAPQSFRPFVRVTTNPDFKIGNRIQLGEGPTLRKVTEHGEFTYGSMGDSKEQVALATYGRIFPVTRQALINDDLQGFTRVPQVMGVSAANLESDLVYEILNTNPTMGDSVALFDSATHGNLGTAGAPSDTTLTEMRRLARLQKGIVQGNGDTGSFLNVMLKYLVCGPKQEVVALKYMTSIIPNAASDVNVFANSMQVIVDPRLEYTGQTFYWYGIADPSQIDTIELVYLEGNEGVMIETDVDFDTDGIKIKARHDVAAKAIDWRGMYRNPATS